MVEAAPCITLECVLDLLPVAVAVLVGQTQKHDIGFLREVLGLLNHIDNHLIDRPLICCDFLLDKHWCLSFE